jgi:hypothetical protein
VGESTVISRSFTNRVLLPANGQNSPLSGSVVPEIVREWSDEGVALSSADFRQQARVQCGAFFFA